MAATLPVAQAAAVAVTIDPGAAGLNGSAFTVDTLYGSEVSVLANSLLADGTVVWSEHGYLVITGGSLGGVAVMPTGLGSSYTLYVEYTLQGAGSQAAGVVQLLGASGASQFSFMPLASAPYVAATASHAGSALLLADALLQGWSAQSTVVSVSPLAFEISAEMSAVLQTAVSGLISSADGGTLWVAGSFDHDAADTQVLGGGALLLITGGTNTLSFVAVPEPQALLLLALAAAAAAAASRQRRRRAGQPG